MNELKEKIGNIGSGTISVCTKPDSKYFLLREEILKATTFLPIETTIGDRIYYIKNNLTSIKLCGCGCGMPVKNPKHIAIFGHSNRMSTVKENKKKSMMEKYNVENPSQLQEIKNKKEQTCLNHFGTKHHMKNNEFKEKFKQMTLDKFGVENVFQLDEVKEQIKATFIEHYGVDHPMKAEVNVEKLKQTMLDRFGVDSPIKNEQIKEKIKQTNLDRLGVATPFESNDVREKCKQTFLEKYGVEHIYQATEIKAIIAEKSKQKFYDNLINDDRLEQLVVPLFSLDEYKNCHGLYKFKCCKCGNEFESNLDGGKTPRCLICYPYLKGQSQAELDIIAHIKNFYTGQILTNCRKILDGNMELDIYLPEKKLAVEFNGLYWHSELNGKDKNYHLKKTVECESKGIRLIHVFEDELLNKREIVYSRIKHIIGCTSYKIGARKCQIKEIEAKQCNTFLNKYHIQGKDNSGIRLGLFYKNRLVAVMTFCKNRVALGRMHVEGEFELSRFATIAHFNVMGAGDKLLKYFERNFKPTKLLSYADRRWSAGGVYFKLGFKMDHMSKPNYFYMKEFLKREHRFGYRKDVLLKEGHSKDLTEWQIMQEKGYDRIWDCGNYVFVKEL